MLLHDFRFAGRLLAARPGLGDRRAPVRTPALVARQTTPFQYISYAVNVHPDGRCGESRLESARAVGGNILRAVRLGVHAAHDDGQKDDRRVLVTAGMTALYLPVRSASAIDPSHTLRSE